VQRSCACTCLVPSPPRPPRPPTPPERLADGGGGGTVRDGLTTDVDNVRRHRVVHSLQTAAVLTYLCSGHVLRILLLAGCRVEHDVVDGLDEFQLHDAFNEQRCKKLVVRYSWRTKRLQRQDFNSQRQICDATVCVCVWQHIYIYTHKYKYNIKLNYNTTKYIFIKI